MKYSIMGVEDVARLMRKTVGTLRYDMSRRPQSIPKWFKAPNSRKPLWLTETVEAFIHDSAKRFDALPPSSATCDSSARAKQKRGDD